MSVNKYRLKLNCEARKMTMLTVTKPVLASETKEECWNLFLYMINEVSSFRMRKLRHAGLLHMDIYFIYIIYNMYSIAIKL